MDIFTLFLLLLHYVGWKFFSLISWWEGWISVGESFHRFLDESPRRLRQLSVCWKSSHDQIGWKSFCLALCLFIYLLIYLFIICLLIYLLFIYFKGAVYKVMHQFCGWVPLGGAISIKLCSNFSEIALAHFALLRLCCWMWYTACLLF